MADAEGTDTHTVHTVLKNRLAESAAALTRETADVRERMLAGLEQQERTLSLISAGIASDGRPAPTYAEIIAANRALAAVRGQLATMQGIRPAGDDIYTDWLASVAAADRADGGADTVAASAWQSRAGAPEASRGRLEKPQGPGETADDRGVGPGEKHDQPAPVHR